VIITADHGEGFGEHGLFKHGYELWEEVIRVPLLFYVKIIISPEDREPSGLNPRPAALR
jgi:arylsulfatase A-like enzyme